MRSYRSGPASLIPGSYLLVGTRRLVSPRLVTPAELVNLGATGVDVFFVLSGFLMMYISGPYFRGERSALHFLAQRLIRIWPLYALVTTVLLLPLFWLALKTHNLPFNLHLIRLASFAFIPSFDDKGLLQPILGVGWTLNYEMLFYICFASILVVGRRRAMPTLVGVFVALFLAGLYRPHSTVGAFLSNSVIFEFLLGAALGTALAEGRRAPTYGAAWIGAGVLLLLIQPFFRVCRLFRESLLAAYQRRCCSSVPWRWRSM